jgi:hypothetical protein
MTTVEHATFIAVAHDWYSSVTKVLSGEMVKVKVKTEDSCLLGCYDESIGKYLPSFRSNSMSTSSG